MIRTFPLCRVIGTLLACLLSVNGHGHGETPTEVGTRVSAAVSVTWRDDGMLLQDDGRWLIPGVLMGGEAYPVDGGVTVDEARLDLAHRTAERVFGRLQISSHDGVSDAEIHHAYGGLQLDTGPVLTTLAAGRMAAAMTPANGEHASDRLFSETPLPLQAFLGSQLNDDGARVSLDLGAWQLGLESWRGDSFPAAGEGEELNDVYLHYRDGWNGVPVFAGIWWLQADAVNRSDTRYSADGHDHGSVSQSTTLPEYWFDGRTEIGGAFLRLAGGHASHWHWALEAQYLQVSIEGSVRDSTRLAPWSAEDNGGWLQASLGRGAHTLGLRWERLVLENHLSGAAAGALADLTGLYNPDHDPQRSSAVYHWQVQPGLALRLEAVDDGIQMESIQRIAVGLVWQAELL
ncbi:hypothetical protein [Ketobacter sp.]|uniref:hypothetical protein n=1 Tax=Ketobacter sp. TaxID=2083498 RepID=UPI000F256637|nr:hypothetical protein [Ketobacter sp.]RLT96811.1 MAG: hypothetical protein D9N14_12285 [Ketobacter sp.]